MHPIYSQVEVLLNQHRAEEAIKRLQPYLQDHPDDEHAIYLLAFALFLNKKLSEAREYAERLHSVDPNSPRVIRLLSELDLAEAKYDDAERKAQYLRDLDPEDPSSLMLLAWVKFLQRYYDVALRYVDEVLELDAGNSDALNLKVRMQDLIGHYDPAKKTILELLHKDPENPTTLANHGLQLLNEGKVEEAMKLFSQALSIQPSNNLARYGLMEALKSRFFLYRLFYHYEKWMSRLSGQNIWLVIIGSYLLIRLISSLSAYTQGPIKWLLSLIIFLTVATFFLSWVTNPLMNLALSRNRYGRLLLDENDKKMARLTGGSLVFAILCGVIYFSTAINQFLMAAFLFIGLMIPAGTYLNPAQEDRQKKLKYFGLGILLTGVIGVAFPGTFLMGAAFIGLFIYQFYYNKLMISNFARKFEK